MEEKICYFNGEYIKESEAKIHISDWAIWEGGVYDIGRTFNHIPFKLEEHIGRLLCSLRCLPFIRFNVMPHVVKEITLEVLKRNEEDLDPKDDYRYIYRVTRGITSDTSAELTFYVYLDSLAPLVGGYEKIATWYREGAHMVVASTRQIPPQCLDPKIKHSNRLCNSLAEFEAKMVDPEAFPLMLDIYGFATECARQSFLMVKDGIVLTSRLTNSLGGITRATVLELAKELGIECLETDLCVYDLYNADEIMITSSSFCIIPVSRFNDRLFEEPMPGPITKQLMSAFSKLVSCDFVQQIVSNVRGKAEGSG